MFHAVGMHISSPAFTTQLLRPSRVISGFIGSGTLAISVDWLSQYLFFPFFFILVTSLASIFLYLLFYVFFPFRQAQKGAREDRRNDSQRIREWDGYLKSATNGCRFSQILVLLFRNPLRTRTPMGDFIMIVKSDWLHC